MSNGLTDPKTPHDFAHHFTTWTTPHLISELAAIEENNGRLTRSLGLNHDRRKVNQRKILAIKMVLNKRQVIFERSLMSLREQDARTLAIKKKRKQNKQDAKKKRQLLIQSTTGKLK